MKSDVGTGFHLFWSMILEPFPAGKTETVTLISNREALIEEVAREVRSQDGIFTLGAGDVYKIGEEILKKNLNFGKAYRVLGNVYKLVGWEVIVRITKQKIPRIDFIPRKKIYTCTEGREGSAGVRKEGPEKSQSIFPIEEQDPNAELLTAELHYR